MANIEVFLFVNYFQIMGLKIGNVTANWKCKNITLSPI